MRVHKSRLVVVLVATAALLVAACGSSDSGSSDSTSGGGGGGGTTRGVTDTEIKVAGLAPLTSPQGGYAGINEGARARLERANRDGGIAGRTINFVGTEDDGEDPGRNFDLANRLVQDDEVFALVPTVGLGFTNQTTDFLMAQEVPFYGWAFMPGYCDNPWAFGFNGCIVGTTTVNSSTLGAPVDAFDLQDGDTVAIQSWDSDVGRNAQAQFEQSAEHYDLEVVYARANMAPTETNFTPLVQPLLATEPDLVLVNGPFAVTVGMVGALRAAGYDGYVVNFITYEPGLLESNPSAAAALDGTYVNVQTGLPEEFGGTAIEQMKDDLRAIGANDTITTNVSIGYWSADMFIQQLEAVGEELTLENFNRVINEGWEYVGWGDPVGLGDLEFPEGHQVAAPCAAIVGIDGVRYTPELPMTCYENLPLN